MENIKINVMTLFSGYDSQCMALDRLKANYPFFDYELVYWCEIDENAIKAHNAIYPQWSDRNLGDISKVNFKECNDREIDLMTYSFPCTNISSSGKQAGFEKGSGTASSLLWEVERAIKELRPKYLMMENVKALMSNKFRPLFKLWCSTVESYGYSNFVNILNASDFNCPQNRERVFMISVLGEGQDVKYYFPKKMKLERRIKDILEPNVDESFYLSDKALEYFCRVNNGLNGSDESSCVGKVSNSQDGVVSGVNAIAPTLTAGHANQPKLFNEE